MFRRAAGARPLHVAIAVRQATTEVAGHAAAVRRGGGIFFDDRFGAGFAVFPAFFGIFKPSQKAGRGQPAIRRQTGRGKREAGWRQDADRIDPGITCFARRLMFLSLLYWSNPPAGVPAFCRHCRRPRVRFRGLRRGPPTAIQVLPLTRQGIGAARKPLLQSSQIYACF
jgi:hypothetical protein